MTRQPERPLSWKVTYYVVLECTHCAWLAQLFCEEGFAEDTPGTASTESHLILPTISWLKAPQRLLLSSTTSYHDHGASCALAILFDTHATQWHDNAQDHHHPHYVENGIFELELWVCEASQLEEMTRVGPPVSIVQIITWWLELMYRTIISLYTWTAPRIYLLFYQWRWRRWSFCYVSVMTMTSKPKCKDK